MPPPAPSSGEELERRQYLPVTPINMSCDCDLLVYSIVVNVAAL
jgi:hypothetical protein